VDVGVVHGGIGRDQRCFAVAGCGGSARTQTVYGGGAHAGGGKSRAQPPPGYLDVLHYSSAHWGLSVSQWVVRRFARFGCLVVGFVSATHPSTDGPRRLAWNRSAVPPRGRAGLHDLGRVATEGGQQLVLVARIGR